MDQAIELLKLLRELLQEGGVAIVLLFVGWFYVKRSDKAIDDKAKQIDGLQAQRERDLEHVIDRMEEHAKQTQAVIEGAVRMAGTAARLADELSDLVEDMKRGR